MKFKTCLANISKYIIVKSQKNEDEFVSNIFTRPKKDGGIRVILNLKQFQKSKIFWSH